MPVTASNSGSRLFSSLMDIDKTRQEVIDELHRKGFSDKTINAMSSENIIYYYLKGNKIKDITKVINVILSVLYNTDYNGLTVCKYIKETPLPPKSDFEAVDIIEFD